MSPKKEINIKQENSNIRNICQNRNKNTCNEDNRCQYIESNGKCVLSVPKYKLNFFIGQLVNELVKYGKKVYNNQTNDFAINVNGKILDDSVIDKRMTNIR